MSHLIEEYAKNLGVIASRPVISEHYYPVDSKGYITIQTTKKFDSRNYEHWNIFLSLFKKYAPDIDVVHVGVKEDPEVKGIDLDLRGETTFKQMFYILGRASLHVGIDSLGVHIASALDIPCVGLYSNMLSENSGPVWHKKSKYICIDSFKNGLKPSYSETENPKTINNICPENVAQSALSLLGIENDLEKYETLNIGNRFLNHITEIVPDFSPKSADFVDKLVNLRFDYGLLEESAHEWLSRKCNLMINKPLDLSLIKQYQDNIVACTIFLGDHDFNEEYFSTLDSLGIKFTLISRYENKLSDLRLKFFDHTIEQYKINKKKDLDFISDICDNTLYYSNKTLISKNKKYYSKAAWKAGIEKTEEHQPIIDNKDFWEEVQHLNIYNYAEKKHSKHKKRK